MMRLAGFLRTTVLWSALGLCVAFMALPAHALSEIQREELPPASDTPPASTPETAPADQAPGAEPVPAEPAPAAESPQPEAPAGTVEQIPLPEKPGIIDNTPVESEEGEPETMPGQPANTEEGHNRPKDDDIPVPQVERDLSSLPAPVRRMRELIIEACQTGDLEKLRPLIGLGADITTLSFGGVEGDPIEFLRGTSGDTQGQEILAILLEVLEAGYVHLDAGTEKELYVWPYFFAYPLDKLTPPQKVELFKLVTAGDFEDMQSFGAYIFYRVGITPEGRWSFFVAGD
ncbi:MAG: hypothetical protein KDJ74_16940 [Notoacmeibacter sp.]|nr:hypothetical protein [Notoacmeibacter sp.]